MKHRLWIARRQASSLRQLLTNPTYTGTLYANRERVTVPWQRRSPLQPVGHSESSVPTPPVDWIEVCQIPVIVSQECFEQVHRAVFKILLLFHRLGGCTQCALPPY